MIERQSSCYELEHVKHESKPGESEKDINVQDNNIGPSYAYKIFITGICILIWICHGIAGSMYGTTLPDQRDRLGVTLEDMGVISSTAAMVALVGALINSILTDRFLSKTMLIVAVYLLLESVLLITQKFVTNYAVFFALYVMYIFCLATCDTVGQIVMLKIWGKDVTGPMYILHMGVYIGGAMGPFIARPFLSPDVGESANCTLPYVTCISTTSQPEITTIPPRYQDGSRIELAFLVPGTLLFLTGVCFLFSYIIAPPMATVERVTKDNITFKELFHPRTCAHTSINTAVVLLFTFFLFYFLNQGTTAPTTEYLFIYATEGGLGFSKEDAALIDGIYYFFGFAGRLISGILAIWIPIQYTFPVNLAVIAIDGIALGIWGKDDQLAFVTCVWIQSFFVATMWPGCISWTDKYITLTATAFFLAPFGNAIGRAVFIPFYAKFYDNGNPEVTLYGVGLFGTMIFLLSCFRQVVGWYQGPRFENVKPNDENDTLEVIAYKEHNGFENLGYVS